MLKRIKKNLFFGASGDVFKGMLTLLKGASLARVVGLVCIPILAHLYSPEDYGILALYTSFVAVFAPLLTLRYVQAIPLPRTDAVAFNLFTLCFKLIVIGSLIIAGTLYLFSEIIFGWFNMHALTHWWWLVVLGIAGTSMYELFSLWATRKKQYGTIAKTQFTQSLIGNITKIGLGFLAIKPAGLLIGQFLNQSAGVASFIKGSKREFRFFLSRTNRNKEWRLAKYYRAFFLYRTPSELLMVLALQAPILMTAKLFDSTITGQLSFTLMALSLPVGLIGISMSKAYYAEVARIGKKDIVKIKLLTIDIQKKLFIAAIPIALFTYFFAEWVFVFVFGEKWRMAGQFASMLSPFLLLKFTSSPLDQVFNVISTQVIYLFINLTRVIGFVIIFMFFYRLELTPVLFVSTLSWFLAGHYLMVTMLVIFVIHLASRKV